MRPTGLAIAFRNPHGFGRIYRSPESLGSGTPDPFLPERFPFSGTLAAFGDPAFFNGEQAKSNAWWGRPFSDCRVVQMGDLS